MTNLWVLGLGLEFLFPFPLLPKSTPITSPHTPHVGRPCAAPAMLATHRALLRSLTKVCTTCKPSLASGAANRITVATPVRLTSTANLVAPPLRVPTAPPAPSSWWGASLRAAWAASTAAQKQRAGASAAACAATATAAAAAALTSSSSSSHAPVLSCEAATEAPATTTDGDNNNGEDDDIEQRAKALPSTLRKAIRLMLLGAALWFGDGMSSVAINVINILLLLYYTKPNSESIGPFLARRRQEQAALACAKPLQLPGLGTFVGSGVEAARRAAATYNPATALYSVDELRDFGVYLVATVSQPMTGERLCLIGLFGEWWVLRVETWLPTLPKVRVVY